MIGARYLASIALAGVGVFYLATLSAGPLRGFFALALILAACLLAPEVD